MASRIKRRGGGAGVGGHQLKFAEQIFSDTMFLSCLAEENIRIIYC